MVAIAHVVTALHVVSGTLLIVDRLEGGGIAATSDLNKATSTTCQCSPLHSMSRSDLPALLCHKEPAQVTQSPQMGLLKEITQ